MERAPLTYDSDERGWLDYEPFVPAVRVLRDRAVVEERVETHGVSVHVDRLPVPDAPATVVVVHGIGGYGRLVLALAGPWLQDAGFEVVAPDLPGYGLTRVDHRRLTFPLWVDVLTALVDRESRRVGRPVVLLGLSLGGTVAFHTATRCDRVVGLAATTLLDPRDRTVAAGISRWPRLASLGVPLLRPARALLDPIRLPAGLLSKLDAIANDPQLAALVARDPLGGGVRLPLRFLRTLVATDPAREPAQYTRPVLVLHPALDRMTDIALTRRFVRHLPDASLVELHGCGHFPVEEPGQSTFRHKLVEFVDGLTRQPSERAPTPT